MRVREASEPDGEQDSTGARKSVRGFGGRRPTRQRGDDRRSRRRARRPPRGDDRGHEREDHRCDNCPPREVEAVDAMPDERLEPWREQEPREQPDNRSGERAHSTDDRAVRDHREPHVPVGRAERAQHAQRAQAALRHHGEPRGGDQAHEQEADGLERENNHRGRSLAQRTARPDARRAAGRMEVVDLPAWGVEQDRHLRGRVGLARCHERELVAQVEAVLDDADNAARTPVGNHGVADVHVQRRGRARGQGDVTRARRKPPGDEAQQRMPELAVGVLRAQIERVERSRYRDALVVDLVDRAEGSPRRGDIGSDVAAERHQAVGSAETRVLRMARVVRECDADGRRRNREDHQRQHEHLLTPLPPEQPPRPTEDRPSRGPTTRGGHLHGSGSLLECEAHRCASGVSSDSGPAGGIV